eukprot:scaffold4151_cov137-Skeletonema_menzelii.AAC.7
MVSLEAVLLFSRSFLPSSLIPHPLSPHPMSCLHSHCNFTSLPTTRLDNKNNTTLVKRQEMKRG